MKINKCLGSNYFVAKETSMIWLDSSWSGSLGEAEKSIEEISETYFFYYDEVNMNVNQIELLEPKGTNINANMLENEIEWRMPSYSDIITLYEDINGNMKLKKIVNLEKALKFSGKETWLSDKNWENENWGDNKTINLNGLECHYRGDGFLRCQLVLVANI